MTRSSLASMGGTDESRALREVAHRLAERCPVELGVDIAITGSAARGLADTFSDIEIIWRTIPINSSGES